MATTQKNAPVEPKVVFATAASALITFLITAVSNGLQNEDHGVLLTGIPDILEPLVITGITALATFLSGWWAKHQHRRPAPGSPIVTNSGTVID
jgi:hypothetical protein